MKCIQSKCHVFIEKPISHNLTGYKKFKELIIKNKRHVEVGYMMRYHPCIIQIKNGLTKEKSEKFCISSQSGRVPARMASMGRLQDILCG